MGNRDSSKDFSRGVTCSVYALKRPLRDPKGRANQELSAQARGPAWQQCQPGMVGAGLGRRKGRHGAQKWKTRGEEVPSPEPGLPMWKASGWTPR